MAKERKTVKNKDSKTKKKTIQSKAVGYMPNLHKRYLDDLFRSLW